MPSTIPQMLVAAGRHFGAKPAVVAVDRTLTFAELDQLSTQLALQLHDLGVVRGDTITLWLENGWRWMVTYYAILKLGAVVNPCNVLLTAEEVAFIARDCAAVIVIAPRNKLADLRSRDIVRIIVDSASEDNAAEPNIDRLLAAAPPATFELPGRAISARSPATIGYTSGTTGRPKGAVLRHSAIILNTALTSLMHARTGDDIVVSALPCAHVYGNIVMNSAVLCGMTLVLLPRFEEESVLRAIERHRATMFEGVPTMFMKILNFPGFEQFDLSSLRLCTVGGQTMPPAKFEEVQRRFGCRLIELWGMTELGGLGTTHPYNGPSKSGSIGIAMPFVEAKVASVENAAVEMPRGEVGELMVRGPIVMQGYLKDRAATRAAIEPDGWLHTGDLVRQDGDGYIYVVDRAKDVIISGGYNVYPAEVERAIAEHAAVAMAAVVAMPDELKGQVPKAFIVLRPQAQCATRDIIDHCRCHLASYKIPREVVFVTDLPKTSTGKILRRALTTYGN